MADISDVEKALVEAVVAVVYPNGTSNPSMTGGNVRIYRGWPSPDGLNADLAVGILNVSVFSDPKSTRDTTRYPRIWKPGASVATTLAVTLTDGAATFSGTGGVGQNAGVLVDAVGYAVAVGANDTPATVADSLARQIDGAVANGAILSVPSSPITAARVEGSGVVWQETRRQEQMITVSFWCADPESRDSLTGAVDATLSQVDWLSLPDGSCARLLYKGTNVTDASENADLYRRDLSYTTEFPTIVQQTVAAMVFGTTTISLDVAPTTRAEPIFPLLGAIRFDAWYDPTDTIDQQCASALAGANWTSRLPPNALVASDGTVSWPLAPQAVIDTEIIAAVDAGLDFWAFDAYKPDDGLSLALSLYLSSPVRAKLQFCMLGQSSAWAAPTTTDNYSSTFDRDIAMMSEAGYVQVDNGRPLYFVLDASAADLATLPSGGIATAIATIRARALAAGAGNPYIIWLSGAALADYDNTIAAKAAGADAAGAYATPRYSGSTLPYSTLTATAANDWQQRIAAGFPMVPTAMTGWDQRPLIERPQPFYPVPPNLTAAEYYQSGTPAEIADHIVAMAAEIRAFPASCPAGIGLIYAWNELAEGGWLMPTYTVAGPDQTRVSSLGSALAAARLAAIQTKSTTS